MIMKYRVAAVRAALFGLAPLLLGVAMQSAAAEDFGTDLRQADAVGQKIYQAAISGRSPPAMYALGVMSDEQSDETEAFRWYKLASEHGHAESMKRIGGMYAQGHGGSQDYVAAAAWYLRAVGQKSLSAASNRATLH